MLANTQPFNSTIADSFLALAAGVSGIVTLTWILVRWIQRQRAVSSSSQRTAWQVGLLILWGLAVSELAGISTFVVHLAGWTPTTNLSSLQPRRAFHENAPSPEVSARERAASATLPDAGNQLHQSPEGEAPSVAITSLVPLQPPLTAAGRALGYGPGIAVAPKSPSIEMASILPGNERVSKQEHVNPWNVRADADGYISSATIGPWLTAFWLLGTGLLALRLLLARAVLVRFSRRLRPLKNDALARRLYLVARKLGIHRPVRLRESAGITAPMAWGVLRPTIVLPPNFVEDFSPDEQQAMLAHELGHLRDWDPAWQRLADWLTAVLWWHPLAWWLRGRLRCVSESAADEASLAVKDGPELLAGCLVRLGGRVSGIRPLGWVGMQGRGFRSHLGQRVARLLALGNRRRRPTSRWTIWAKSLAPIAVVVAVIFCTSWARSEVSYQGEADMKMLKHYWRHSVLGAAMVLTWSAANAPPANAEETSPDAAIALFPDGEEDGERAREKDRDRPKKERARRDDDRRRGDRDRPRPPGKGDRPRKKDRPREGDRPGKDDRPREGDRPSGGYGEKRDRPRPPRDEERPKDRPRDDVERRVRHLIDAAENLEAAGLREQAQNIRREAEKLRRSHDGDRPRGAHGVGAGAEKDRPRPQGNPHIPRELMEAIRDLRKEVNRLRAEMAEMRAMMHGHRHEGRPGKGAERPKRKELKRSIPRDPEPAERPKRKESKRPIPRDSEPVQPRNDVLRPRETERDR